MSEADIALFAGVSGDLSPLTIQADHGAPRAAPPALIVALALGLGTVDMPVPMVAEWEWLNWRFPRPVHAGDTLYARWTLTQKRPPVAGAATSIVVWRVDVHTADGALCAEGEVGAKIVRGARSGRETPAGSGADVAPAPGAEQTQAAPSRTNGTPAPEPPAVAAPPAAAAKPERTSGPSRRRRRRRSGGSPAQQEEHEPRAAHVEERAPEPQLPPAGGTATSLSSDPVDRGTISRVLKRLRRT